MDNVDRLLVGWLVLHGNNLTVSVEALSSSHQVSQRHNLMISTHIVEKPVEN